MSAHHPLLTRHYILEPTDYGAIHRFRCIYQARCEKPSGCIPFPNICGKVIQPPGFSVGLPRCGEKPSGCIPFPNICRKLIQPPGFSVGLPRCGEKPGGCIQPEAIFQHQPPKCQFMPENPCRPLKWICSNLRKKLKSQRPFSSTSRQSANSGPRAPVGP